MGKCDRIFSGDQPRQFGAGVQGHHSLMMEIERVSETLATCSELTQPVAREDVIAFSHRQSFKSLMGKSFIFPNPSAVLTVFE
jgi:hypothetical protein